MKYTNRHNLPGPLARALANDTYSRGEAHISVTTLIDSPQVAILKERHDGEIVEDVMDRIWSKFGTAIHSIIEDGSRDLPGYRAEERIFCEVNGWIVSGAVDLQTIGAASVVVTDWKTCSVWSVQNEKSSWQNQLNIYASLIERSTGKRVEELWIGAVMRDWKQGEADRTRGYPQVPIQMVRIELWPREKRNLYLEQRVKIHQEARRAAEWGEELPPCNAEEMWAHPDEWAVYKKGGKRAVKLCNSEREARELLTEYEGGRIEARRGTRVRCERFCPARNHCPQFKIYREGNNDRSD